MGARAAEMGPAPDAEIIKVGICNTPLLKPFIAHFLSNFFQTFYLSFASVCPSVPLSVLQLKREALLVEHDAPPPFSFFFALCSLTLPLTENILHRKKVKIADT